MKMNIIDSVKNTAFSAAVHTALEYLEKNPEFPIVKDTTPNITNSRLNNIP